ncbi:MAG: transposase [bacterium]|nr:transposase [Nanoarchaeota archaeon]
MKYRKHVRLSSELYTRQGWYFVTLVSRKRQNLFTEQIKTILEDVLKDIPKMFLGWEIDFFAIMPNHLHFILLFKNSCMVTEVLPPCPCPLSSIVGAYKSLVCKRLREEMDIKKSPWQLNYYEHIIRSEEELRNIRLYIKANLFEESIDWKQVENYVL